jgi:phosphohistidine phosphatase
MRTLLLMRHAKSSWKDESLADDERPLNKRGQQAAARMGRFLAENDLVPDTVICSTAKRARQTARRVKEAAGCKAKTHKAAALYFQGAEA